ncbi:sensor domain-containing protein [Dendrosporobacter sp. 1207_IL3150]|uniref:sensor domain-containing protein n=1 Tax=Dendrosporobacter sp. 1207_IL3150 TaxID=3084054 RepID=UPI002FD8D154
MKFDFGYAGTYVICVLVMIIVWLLVKYYRMKEQLKKNEERFSKLINKLALALSCDKSIICNDEKFMDDEAIMAILNDITDRKVEADLRNSKKLLSLAAELTHLGPWKYYNEKNLLEFDDEFYIIYGTDVAREGSFMTMDEYARKFVHPDDVCIIAMEVEKMRMTTERHYTAEFEHRIIRRDGEVRTILVRVDTEKDNEGKIQKCYGANQDITERKAMEAALHNSREMLSLAAELAHLGPWKYHHEEGLFEFGDEFYAIFGTDVAREGAFMTPEVYWREFVHPDDAWMFKTSEVKRTYEHRIIRRDGEVRIVAVQGNIVKDAAGKIIKWYGATQDITEQKQAEATLRHQTEKIRRIAYTDVLTGLSNRAHLNEMLEGEMEQARRGMSTGGVLFIDLDDLKTVNDTLGHTYGDAIIVEAGKRIAKEVGKNAIIARIGGDEFVVILPGKRDRQCIATIADGVIHALCQNTEVFGEIFHLSASIGVTIYPDDDNTAEGILKNADNAMYFAKNSGKNCWKFYDVEMQAVAYEKMMLTKSLHRAVGNNEFEVYYQPQVNIADGAIVGFEALLRWNSPEHESIPPVRFIPLAEQSGLINIIGDWVLQEACQFARRLADNGWGNICVAVNVSPHQLCADRFIDSVRDALLNAGVLPHQLEIEITENVLIASFKDSISKLEELQSMGVRLALDDFGTGYSSLTYLQRLPVQTLKIDKSFIDMILVPGSKKAIISTIVDMAHQMKMTVVAEGVETEEQLEYLAKIHCNFAQGYLFSRPVPKNEALQLLSPR